MMPLTPMALKALMSVSSPSDPDYSDVELLLHFDGANGSTTLTDQKGHSVSCYAGCDLSTAQAKFGKSSLLLTAASYVAAAPNADFQMPSDFTVEYWVYPTVINNYHTLNDCRSSGASTGGWSPFIAPNGNLNIYSGANVASGGTVVTGEWQHLAFSRVGSSFLGFIQGTQTLSWTTSTSFTDGYFYMGGGVNGGEGMIGYVDDFRFTKGVGRYTSNFTPPARRFPNK